MKKILSLIFALCTLQAAAEEFIRMELPASGNGIAQAQYEKDGKAFAISRTTLYALLPEKSKATGQAAVIFPGGGYRLVAFEHEGFAVARWLVSKGIAAIVSCYALPNGHPQIPLEDAKAAMNLVREKAAAWNIEPSRVGVIGFSAGGHLASTIGTRFDEASRPAFMALFYPNISFLSEYTREAARTTLLGPQADDPQMLKLYSGEMQVTVSTPPAFIALCNDDRTVDPDHSLRFYRALKENKVPCEMHIFPSGGHGWGFKPEFKYHGQMLELLERWLKER
ncbi:hypothetical protein FACS1894159_00980 [Bacteroidia bacterium]|nr:hypothetical protein FACS1894159_00980 [Bacteroidia bacterium]